MNYMAEQNSEDVYGTFNLLMRRKPKENNFKAVLESIRDLMNENYTVPSWLHDILLGYGDPAAAQYQFMEDTLQTVDFKDTFLDAGAQRVLPAFLCVTNSEAHASHVPLVPSASLYMFLFTAADHVREAFPEYHVEFAACSTDKEPKRPFKITFPPFKPHEQQQATKVSACK